jgi:thioredoxin reductase (NADPH)
MHDIIVIGGGPAGMTAALYAQRNGKSALVIEKAGFGGQITHSPKVENYPGTLSMSGNEFADKTLDQIMKQGADIEIDTVTGIEDLGDRKIVRTECGSFEGKTVVIATGVRHRMLGLEGENELVGEGISFCAVCDGDFFTGRSVIVAGGGNSALQEAILLADKCSKVTVLQDLPFFTGETKLQEVLFARPNVEKHTGMKITGILSKDGVFAGVTALDKETGVALSFEADGMFEAVGLIPENEAFADLAELDGFGYFESGESCLTKTPGVFVAGDCRAKSIRQLTTAASDGAVAAMAACRYINGA